MAGTGTGGEDLGFFSPVLYVFVRPFNLSLSLTALCEQIIPLVLLDLLPKYAGDAQPL